MEKVIDIKGLVFKYNDRVVLDALDLEVRVGDRIGLIGPNGAGKTTLLYLIMGFLKPLKGKIFILEKERKEEKDFIEVRQKIGLLFQDSDSQLFCPTVKEDIAFGPLNLGKRHEEVREIIDKVAHFLGIVHLLDRPVYKLSGGEKRLVALAGIFAMNPICYLLDEPSAGLDEQSKTKLIEFLKTQSTYLIVSHEKDFLKEVSNKIFKLEKGKLFQLL
ncbi:energy-coupling factor ABC transporter ATP-binding protein [Thermodesulfobacterium hveragerdense]|uniref:energy-coupling factor ABC transporter ATP-binding protein n=1 Tax=Thermodesulfobacterium hveragerdense TaxID=53424 RepID=UPI0004233204|nr:ABC transporter ATP-binding protein [Thermodesulfobacterium hveragerdense]